MNTKIRSIWISDCHLGCPYAHADELLNFLKGKNPEYFYIVGDFIDGWKLKKKWHWDNTYNLIIRRILGMVKKGTQVYYITGNHDEFLRPIMDFANDFGNIDFANEIIHTTVNGKKILVVHGDQFDAIIINAKWLAILGDMGYEFLIRFNKLFNKTRKYFGYKYWSLSKTIKHKVKEATNFIGRFENILCEYAKKHGCDGVLAGHIHTPCIKEIQGVKYFNCGDWLENATAIIEYSDGRIELYDSLTVSPN